MAGKNYKDVSGAWSGVAVTPSNSTVFPAATRALYVGTGGNITVMFTADTASITLPNVPVGILPVQVVQVLATGTTASSIVALF